MLVLTIESGEVFWVGDVAVKAQYRGGGQIRLAFDGPREVPIDRDRVRQAKLRSAQERQDALAE